MAIIKWTPLYEPWLDMERAFEGFSAGSAFNPACDLYEQGNALVAEVALAGIDPDKVTISIEDNMLSLEGSLERQTEVDEKNYYRREVKSGGFHRLVSLPTAVNAAETKAAYAKGILKIIMPKKEQLKPQTIKIDIKK